MGELHGITITPELHAILVAVLALPQYQPPASTTTTELESEECNNDDSTTAADDSMAGSRPTIIISQFPRMTVDSATSILNAAVMAPTPTTTTTKSELLTTVSASTNNSTANTSNDNDDNNSKNSPSLKTPSLSLEGVIAAKFLIDHSVHTTTEDTASLQLLLHQLEKALRSSTLSFDSSSNTNITANNDTTSNSNTTTRIAFAKRLERLRLHTEERSYSRLTTNIQHPAAHRSADDITVKSMTYAASVGLNMIVGPLAFGTFMYFFAGGVLDHFFLGDTTTTTNNYNSSNHYSGHSGAGGGVDVRRVIAGVLSGAFMLFVEMILFVIRSHELDASVRKKGKRAEYRANPFGYTQKSMARTYVGDD